MCPALRYAAVVRLGRLAALGAAAVAGLAAAELVHRRAASGEPADHPDARTEAIIVLGYRSGRDGTPSPVQRWRCEIAVRSMDPSMSSTLIMSGWRGEAEVMAAYVHDVLGVPSDRIVLEKQARSTWENIAYSLPIAQDYDVIKIASFVLSYIMLAKAMTRLFVISECVFALSYLALVYVFTAYFGLVGAMYAFAANYLLYLVFNVWVARRYLRRL